MKRLLVFALVALFLASLSLSGAAAQNGGDRAANGLHQYQQWAQQSQNNDEDSQMRHQNRHRLTVNGQAYNFGDSEPIVRNGRCLVPIRAVSAVLGAEVDWDEEDKTVYITLDGVTLEITVEDDIVKMYRLEDDEDEWEEIVLDVPAQVSNGRVVVPLRLIAEALGYDVDYDSATCTVGIRTKGNAQTVQDRLHDQLRDASCLTADRDPDEYPKRLRDGTCHR